MAVFEYSAKNERGEEITGRIESSDLEDARQQLSERGLDVSELWLVAEIARPSGARGAPGRLSPNEADEMVQHVAQVTSANIPLAAGLRAAADESTTARLARALNWMASQVDQGQPLDGAVQKAGKMLPPHVGGLILAASRTGTVGDALFELVEYQRQARTLKRTIFGGFAYPLCVVVLATIVLALIVFFISGVIERMFAEFGLMLPLATRLLFWWRDTGWWLLFIVVAVVAAALALYRLVAGRAGWRRLVATIPLIGPLWYWSAIAQWSGLLSILLKHQVPLPEALRLAGHGASGAFVGQTSLRLADGVSRGRRLADLIRSQRTMPASLAPLVAWGEEAGALAESFNASQDMFQRRVWSRSILVQSVLPPVVFIAVGCSVLFVVTSSFGPLFSMISSLSG